MNKNMIFAVIIIIILPVVLYLVFTGSAAGKNIQKYSISDIPSCIEKSLGLEAECAFAVSSSRHVVLIAVDAFGWSTWQYAKQQKSIDAEGVQQSVGKNINSIAGNGTVYRAETTYPSTTRVAFPEMVPDYFFDDLKNNNISAACIASAGFFNFIDVCSRSVLKINAKNLDKDRIAGDDDDVALETIDLMKNNDINFIFIHVSIDSTCHDYGPYSDESMNNLYSTDENVGKIFTAISDSAVYRDAIVIISADHGCHATARGGSHGTREAEDMEIPIIIYNAG